MSGKILFVCSANLCRSPMAEAIFRILRKNDEYCVEAGSAGFMQPGRHPPNEVLEVIRRQGGDLSSHLSVGVELALESRPDLILTMTRQHLRSLAELDSSLLRQTFTLKEFVRLGGLEGPRRTDESLTDYAFRVGASRSLTKLQSGTQDDVADPMGRPKLAYERCARELESLISRMLLLICSGPRARGSI